MEKRRENKGSSDSENFQKEDVMRKLKGMQILVAVAVLTGLVLGAYYVTAEERGREAISKEMEKAVGLPMATGEVWQKMTPDCKVSFIWGLWHTIAIEKYLMDKHPELKRDNFSAKAAEGMDKAPLTINETVALIDKYYEANSDQLDKPVTGVLWAMAIKPNLTVGINGRPLKP
jgi:hypothetical protein